VGGCPWAFLKGKDLHSGPKGDGSVDFVMHEVFSGPLLPLIGKSIPDMTRAFEQSVSGLKSKAEKIIICMKGFTDMSKPQSALKKPGRRVQALRKGLGSSRHPADNLNLAFIATKRRNRLPLLFKSGKHSCAIICAVSKTLLPC